MKKSTIVIILLVYLASIVVINFFGMAILAYNVKVYATKIECVNPDMRINSEGMKQAVIKYSEGLTYRIEHKTYPENATVKNITYIYDTEDPFMTIDKDGFFHILKPIHDWTSFEITLKTIDGTNLTTKILIMIQP